jgi:hypothetical protein
MEEILLFGVDVIRHVADRPAGEQLGDDRRAERAGAAGDDDVTFTKIRHAAILDLERLKIRAAAVGFPIAVARRLGTVAASNFLLAIDRMPVALGAARSCLSQRTLGGGRERTLRQSLRINFCRRGRLEGRVGTGHSLHLEQARRGCKPAWMRYRDQS